MDDEVFQSYAQNGEDVVLWRTLGHIANGRYIDVGANDPTYLSITKAFYDHGWRGVTVEPSRYYADLHRAQRPGDTTFEVAVASNSGGTVTLHEISESGLSTLVDEIRDQHTRSGWQVREVEVPTKTLNEILDEVGWAGQDIHFMTVDVEGSEGDVMASIDLQRWRPWVLVVESTAPNSTTETHQAWEPAILTAGYQLRLFDGLSRYYVANEHADKLGHDLSYSPCVFDSYQSHVHRELLRALDAATTDAASWRASYGLLQAELDHLTIDLVKMHHSWSWRLTKPLRIVRRLVPNHASKAQ